MLKLLSIIVTLSSFASLTASAGLSTSLTVTKACQSGEIWGGTEKLPKWLGKYQDFVDSKSSPLYSFSEAVHLKRLSDLMTKSDFEHDFSEFWVGRILFQMKLDPIAHTVFQSILDNSPTTAIKKAAFGCMAEIQKRSPEWNMPTTGIANLPLDASDADAIFLLALKTKTVYQKLLPANHEAFVTGFQGIQNKKYSEAAEALGRFVNSPTAHTDTFLSKYMDEAQLLLGHALYSVARFKEATEHFQKVSKTSNLQIDALNDLSWSYFLSGQSDEAIGISLQLRSGALRHTFSPEPTMVAAMALNELCSYPDSIRMIKAFVSEYAKSYEYLSTHTKDEALYTQLLKVLKSKTDVPTKVATEWMRDPTFLSSQEEINHLLGQPQKLVSLQKNGANEQDVLTAKFIERAQNFVKSVRTAKLKLKPGEELAESYGDQLIQLKRDLRGLTHFYKASKIWRNLAKNYEKKLPSYREKLVAKINHALLKRDAQMLSLLNKVHENTDLIEVEIYDGASQDLIWKNAHPDYEKMTEKWNGKTEDEETASAKVWNWGRFLASDIENAEIWEDELGALKADTTNQCGKKEKYLQVKVANRAK
jgi:hypothetical protein